MKHASEPDATRHHVWRYLGVLVASLGLLIGTAIPAGAAELMRVTFVRHAESEGNASGLIDTSTPGPVLTEKGQQQARDVVGALGVNNYDAIYGSSMVRTQLTAAPMSKYLRLPIQVLPGLQEIEAGVFEGTPEAGAEGGYGLYPIGWTFPGVIPQIPVEIFNKSTVMPGTDLNGFGFDARVDGALQTIYDKGDRNPVVFSHGGTIMFWTMMNVENLSVMEKLQLLQTARLDNTDYVVIEGNPEDGWTLVNWNGQQFSPEPTLGAEVKRQLRTLTRQLAATTKQIVDAFSTGDIGKVVTAVNRGVADAVYSVVKFGRAVNAKVVSELTPKPSAPTPEAPETSETANVAATNSEATDAPDSGNNISALRSRTSDTTPDGNSKVKVESAKDDDTTVDIDSSDDEAGQTDGDASSESEQSTGVTAGDRPDTGTEDASGTTAGTETNTTGGEGGGDSDSQSAAA
jgi:broad specificity phosphatase PhoE